MKGRIQLGTLLGLTTFALVGCTSTLTPCYPHIYLDDRYAIRGTYGGSDQPTGSASCYRFAYSRDGRVVRIDYAKDGEVSPDPILGVPTIVMEYAQGAEKRRYQNETGTPIPNANGVYAVELKYDQSTNPVEWKNLGAGDQLIEDQQSGVAIIRWKYDPLGNLVEQSYFGADGRLKDDKLRGVAIVRWTYEGHNTVEESYFGTHGQLKEDALRGVAIVRWRYGEHGNTVEESYRDVDQRLKEDKLRGVAIVRWKYDRNWGMAEERYFGADQRLTEDKLRGAAIVRWQYDRQGGRISTLMFDKNEIPIKGVGK